MTSAVSLLGMLGTLDRLGILERMDLNRSEMAKELGVSERHLYRLLARERRGEFRAQSKELPVVYLTWGAALPNEPIGGDEFYSLRDDSCTLDGTNATIRILNGSGRYLRVEKLRNLERVAKTEKPAPKSKLTAEVDEDGIDQRKRNRKRQKSA